MTTKLTRQEFSFILSRANALTKEQRQVMIAWRRVNGLRSTSEARPADIRLLLQHGVLVRFSRGGVVWTDDTVNRRTMSEMRAFLLK